MKYIKIIILCIFATMICSCSKYDNSIKKEYVETVVTVQEDNSKEICVYVFTNDKKELEKNNEFISELRNKFEKKYKNNNIKIVITEDEDYLNINN